MINLMGGFQPLQTARPLGFAPIQTPSYVPNFGNIYQQIQQSNQARLQNQKMEQENLLRGFGIVGGQLEQIESLEDAYKIAQEARPASFMFGAPMTLAYDKWMKATFDEQGNYRRGVDQFLPAGVTMETATPGQLDEAKKLQIEDVKKAGKRFSSAARSMGLLQGSQRRPFAMFKRRQVDEQGNDTGFIEVGYTNQQGQDFVIGLSGDVTPEKAIELKEKGAAGISEQTALGTTRASLKKKYRDEAVSANASIKVFDDIYRTLEKAARDAPEAEALYRNLFERIYPGATPPSLEAANSAVSEYIIARVKELPGQLSEKELLFLGSLSPQVKNSIEGNRMIIDFARRKQQRILLRAQQFNKWIKAGKKAEQFGFDTEVEGLEIYQKGKIPMSTLELQQKYLDKGKMSREERRAVRERLTGDQFIFWSTGKWPKDYEK